MTRRRKLTRSFPVVGATAVALGLSSTAMAENCDLSAVVMGDSFSSGTNGNPAAMRAEETGRTRGGPVMERHPSRQSSEAPAVQALEAVDANQPHITIDVENVAVHGAVRDDLDDPSHAGTQFEDPSQLSHVTPDTDIAVVGIGGNDAGFGDFVQDMVLNGLSDEGRATMEQTLADPAFQAEQEQTLTDIADQMSPTGALIAPTYPQMVAPSPAVADPRFIQDEDIPTAREVTTDLNDVNREAVANVAGTVEPTVVVGELENSLAGHEAGSAEPGVDEVVRTDLQSSFHPNQPGQDLMAEALEPQIEDAVLETALETCGGSVAPDGTWMPPDDEPAVVDPGVAVAPVDEVAVVDAGVEIAPGGEPGSPSDGAATSGDEPGGRAGSSEPNGVEPAADDRSGAGDRPNGPSSDAGPVPTDSNASRHAEDNAARSNDGSTSNGLTSEKVGWSMDGDGDDRDDSAGSGGQSSGSTVDDRDAVGSGSVGSSAAGSATGSPSTDSNTSRHADDNASRAGSPSSDSNTSRHAEDNASSASSGGDWSEPASGPQ